MGHWETSSRLDTGVSPAAIWERAYADADAWPRWNEEIKRASLDEPAHQHHLRRECAGLASTYTPPDQASGREAAR